MKETSDEHAFLAEGVITSLEEHLEKAKRLVEMIGEVTMTGHCQRYAKELKQAADICRIATVIVTTLTLAWAVGLAVFGLNHYEDRDWLDYVTRIAVTAALGAFAGYLAMQARIHRNLEITYRSLELKLATLDPFLSTMDPAERHNIKTQLATRYFVGDDSNAPLLEVLEKKEPA